jgi:hypothetical protein
VLCSSIELVLGRISQPGSPPATDPVCLGDTSDVNGSEGALSNPESHMFGFPVTATAGGRGTAITINSGTVRAVRGHYERVNNEDNDACTGNARSTATSTDAGTLQQEYRFLPHIRRLRGLHHIRQGT